MSTADSPASSRVRRIFQMSALLGALASSSACLSLSVVPQDDDEPDTDAGADAGSNGGNDAGDSEVDAGLDAGEPDADTGEPDAEVEDPDAEVVPTEPACFDRGTYAVGATVVKGLVNACNEGRVCVAGKCVALPACTQGVTGDCEFRPEGAHGRIMVVQMQGDYVYWTEFGSYDARGNYLGDGSVARAKVGTWRREELATSLFFLAPGDHQLRVEGDLVLAQVGLNFPDQQSYRTYRMSSSMLGQTAVIDTRFDTAALRRSCSFGGQLYWQEGKKTYRRSLADLDKVEELISDSAFGEPIYDAPNCVAGDGFLVTNNREDSSFYLASTASAGGAWRALAADGTKIVGTYGNRIVGKRFGWLVTATLDANSTAVSWANVAGGAGQDNFGSAIAGDYGYWSTAGVVVRGKLDGSGAQEVVTEVFDGWSLWSLAASDSGVVWQPASYDSIRYAPPPAP